MWSGTVWGWLSEPWSKQPFWPVYNQLELEFGIEKNRTRRVTAESYEPGAKAVIHYETVNRLEYVQRMHKAAMDDTAFYGVIPTRVQGDLFVLALDCDGFNEMLATCNVLKTFYKLNYTIIKSGNEHYWIIVDKVGKISEFVPMMRLLPGVDSRYTDYIERRGYIVLRAMPKDSLPLFPDEANFSNSAAGRWYEAFREYWQSADTAHFLRLKELQKALATKTVSMLAANPNFMI